MKNKNKSPKIPKECPDLEASDNLDVLEIIALLYAFFDEDLDKIKEWMGTPQHALGYVTPTTMILLGREKKLLKYIKSMLSENK